MGSIEVVTYKNYPSDIRGFELNPVTANHRDHTWHYVASNLKLPNDKFRLVPKFNLRGLSPKNMDSFGQQQYRYIYYQWSHLTYIIAGSPATYTSLTSIAWAHRGM